MSDQPAYGVIDLADPGNASIRAQVQTDAPNPAIVPAPEAPQPVEYQVPRRCPVRVLDHEPGEKFKAVIPPDQEARLIARGQLQRVVYERPDERNNQTREG